jgi:hypothetical protein
LKDAVIPFSPVWSRAVPPRFWWRGAAQLVGSVLGAGITCPFHSLTGLPCPGCGLTRSVLALLDGHAAAALRYHPFGPLLFAGLIFALAAGALPERFRRGLLSAMAAFERSTGFTTLVLTLLMLTWSLRLFGMLPLTVV